MSFFSTPSQADQATLQACIAGVRTDNPGNDPAIAAGTRCCQQMELVRQDSEVAKSYVSQISQCILLYRNGDDPAGNVCIDRIRTPPPRFQLPPASYEIAKAMHSEGLARQAMTANALQQGPACHK